MILWTLTVGFSGMVIGGHGEFILPVWSSVTVCGGKNSEPLKKLMDDYPEKLKLQGKVFFVLRCKSGQMI